MSFKAIRNESDVALWLASSTCHNLLSMLGDIAKASCGNPIEMSPNTKGAVEAVVAQLNNISHLVSLHPPVKQPQRYGNTAFRGWLNAVEKEASKSMASVLERVASFKSCSSEHQTILINELSTYWKISFGNSTRIDYGTGHEASFLMFLYCLGKLNILELDPTKVENHLSDVALYIYPTYLSVARLVQRTYMLEPAGSHGVWSLDDYCFLPFLLGASQLIDHSNIRPRSILYDEIIEGYSSQYMYLGAVNFINTVKTGPFQEHSHILYELSTKIRSWEDIFNGLMKMFRVEVLGKFPVAQHFYFGTILKPTWLTQKDCNSTADARTSKDAKGTAATTATMTATMTTTATTTATTKVGETKVPSATPSAPRAPTSVGTLSGLLTTRRPTPIPTGFNPSPSFSSSSSVQHYNPNGRDVLSRYFYNKRSMPKGSSSNTNSLQRLSTPRPVKHSNYTLLDNGISIKGWRITSNKGKMTDSIELAQMKEASDITFPTPEIVFGHNSVIFEHQASGLCININALDGLRSCIVEQAHMDDNDGATTTTASTPTTTTPATPATPATTATPATPATTATTATTNNPNRTLVKYALAETWAQRKDHGITINTAKDGFENLDWTYTPVYPGTIYRYSKKIPYYDITTKLMSNQGIDYDRLKDRTLPILWFDVIDLYETELDDCGSGTLEAKVRVMPTCFFILLRWWLRVDDTMVRIFDTRIYCDLEQNDQVVFETVQKEISYEELKKNGKSIDNKNYMDPNVFGGLLKEIKTEIRTMKI